MTEISLGLIGKMMVLGQSNSSTREPEDSEIPGGADDASARAVKNDLREPSTLIIDLHFRNV